MNRRTRAPRLFSIHHGWRSCGAPHAKRELQTTTTSGTTSGTATAAAAAARRR